MSSCIFDLLPFFTVFKFHYFYSLKDCFIFIVRKYKKFFKIQTRQCTQKAQLTEIVSKHFKKVPVKENEIIAYFIYMVKMKKNRLDNKDQSSNNHGHQSSNFSEKNDSKTTIHDKLP